MPCYYCGSRLRKQAATRDHVVPKSRGGRYTVPCCFSCNNLKADMDVEQFRLKLLGGGGCSGSGNEAAGTAQAPDVPAPLFWAEKIAKQHEVPTFVEVAASRARAWTWNRTLADAQAGPEVIDVPVECLPRVEVKASQPSQPSKAIKPVKPPNPALTAETVATTSLVGLKQGWLVVTSSLPTGIWLTVCRCGRYEQRRRKALLNPENREDCCVDCRRRLYRMCEIYHEITGEWKNARDFFWVVEGLSPLGEPEQASPPATGQSS